MLLQVAFSMSNFTALIILADRTHSPFIQAQFYTALVIPAVIFGLIAGPVVDIVERKTLMLITDGLLALLFFAYIFAVDNIYLIFLIAFLTSSVARFFIPAEAASIPLVVERKTLNHANSFFLFTLMGSVLLGFALAGPVIQYFGGLGTFGEKAPFIISSLFLTIGFFLRLSLRKIEFQRPYIPIGSIYRKAFHLFAESVKEVISNNRISFPIGLLVFVELMIGLLSVIFLEYVRRYLGFELTSVSYILMGPLILGLIMGIVFIDKIEKLYGRKKSILASLLFMGALFIVLGVAPYVFSGQEGLVIVRSITILASFFIGILMVLIAVQARTILQISAHETMHGRIFSFLDVMIAIAIPIPVLFVGFVADKADLLGTIVAIGLGIILLTVMGHKFILRKQ